MYAHEYFSHLVESETDFDPVVRQAQQVLPKAAITAATTNDTGAYGSSFNRWCTAAAA